MKHKSNEDYEDKKKERREIMMMMKRRMIIKNSDRDVLDYRSIG